MDFKVAIILASALILAHGRPQTFGSGGDDGGIAGAIGNSFQEFFGAAKNAVQSGTGVANSALNIGQQSAQAGIQLATLPLNVIGFGTAGEAASNGIQGIVGAGMNAAKIGIQVGAGVANSAVVIGQRAAQTGTQIAAIPFNLFGISGQQRK